VHVHVPAISIGNSFRTMNARARLDGHRAYLRVAIDVTFMSMTRSPGIEAVSPQGDWIIIVLTNT
jgi:hypothetical protein